MRLATFALGCALMLPVAIQTAASVAPPAAHYDGHPGYPYSYHGHPYRYHWHGDYYNYYNGGHYYRYHWHGGYYNYYHGGHYYGGRYRCGVNWCYR